MTGALRRRFMMAIVATSLLIGAAPVFAQLAVVPGHGRMQQVVELSGGFNLFLPTSGGGSASQTILIYTVPANQRLVVTDIWITGSATSTGRISIRRDSAIASGFIPSDGFFAVTMATGIEFAAGQQVNATFTFTSTAGGSATPGVHLRGYLTSP